MLILLLSTLEINAVCTMCHNNDPVKLVTVLCELYLSETRTQLNVIASREGQRTIGHVEDYRPT